MSAYIKHVVLSTGNTLCYKDVGHISYRMECVEASMEKLLASHR